MKLHTHPEEFRELITVVANEKHISESAVERDYYIVMMLKSLADSPYADQCVFKGGTSLSKCYPGSIDRFSEDIDLMRKERRKMLRVTKPCNMSLLNVIAEANEITYEELKVKYLPPKQPGIIQGASVLFDSDLKDLASEGYISINDNVICFLRR